MGLSRLCSNECIVYYYVLAADLEGNVFVPERIIKHNINHITKSQQNTRVGMFEERSSTQRFYEIL